MKKHGAWRKEEGDEEEGEEGDEEEGEEEEGDEWLHKWGKDRMNPYPPYTPYGLL